ncbi:hypothetical protein AX15_000913 [Amanita polypyramis BW_CC]|nr:hypothetical protein AX15_000913 [Amanita polypyramis BW_CC]
MDIKRSPYRSKRYSPHSQWREGCRKRCSTPRWQQLLVSVCIMHALNCNVHIIVLIDPNKCFKAIVSPRQRALKTFRLFFAHTREPPHEVSDDVRDWDYGDYDGLTSADILRSNPTWIIWKDGCPGGESVKEMETRVDSVVAKVREWHRTYLEDKTSEKHDVVIVAHGHFGRVLIARWLGYPLADGRHFNLGTASVSVLGYKRGEGTLDGLNV